MKINGKTIHLSQVANLTQKYYSGNQSFQLPMQFDVTALRQDIKACIPFGYIDHHVKQNYEGGWKTISLRAVNGDYNNHTPTAEASEDYKITAVLKGCPYFKKVINSFQCKKLSIRILKLCAQSSILKHNDNFLGYEDGTFRIHIPIQTNENVEFFVDGNRIQMGEGEVSYVNFNLPHWVNNKSDVDRIHLVIDCKRNAWSDELFTSLGYNFKKELETPAIGNQTARQIIAELQQSGLPIAKELIVQLKAQL